MPLTRQKYPALKRITLEGDVKNATGNFLSKLFSAFPNLCELRLNLKNLHYSRQSSLTFYIPLPHLQRVHLVCDPIPLQFEPESFNSNLPSLKFLTIDRIRDFPVMTQVESICLAFGQEYMRLPQLPAHLDAVFPNLRSVRLRLTTLEPGKIDSPFSCQHFRNLTCLKLDFTGYFDQPIHELLAACPDVVELSLKLPIRLPYFGSENFVSLIPLELCVST